MTSDNNIMVILSSPSGVGKTTLTKKIQQKYQSFKISVSYTTRPPRSNEVNGVDYHFVKKDEFEELIKENKLYEYAIIFDIDWQGTKQLSKFKNLKLIKIFLITENKEETKKRLKNRNQNTASELEKRYNSFDEEIKYWNDYDYILINKNLEVCFKQIENIILNNKKNFSIFSQTAL